MRQERAGLRFWACSGEWISVLLSLLLLLYNIYTRRGCSLCLEERPQNTKVKYSQTARWLNSNAFLPAGQTPWPNSSTLCSLSEQNVCTLPSLCLIPIYAKCFYSLFKQTKRPLAFIMLSQPWTRLSLRLEFRAKTTHSFSLFTSWT